MSIRDRLKAALGLSKKDTTPQVLWRPEDNHAEYPSFLTLPPRSRIEGQPINLSISQEGYSYELHLPNATLTTDQALTPDETAVIKTLWGDDHHSIESIRRYAELGAMTQGELRNLYVGSFPPPEQTVTWAGKPVPSTAEWEPVEVSEWSYTQHPIREGGIPFLQLTIDQPNAQKLISNLERCGNDATVFHHYDGHFFVTEGMYLHREEFTLQIQRNMMTTLQVTARPITLEILKDHRTGTQMIPPIHLTTRAQVRKEDFIKLIPAPCDDPETDDVDLSGEFE